MELEGKVAFITGGGGGIGGGLAEAFVERGMKLVLADLELARAQTEATKYGHRAIALRIDVTSPESWHAARAEALQRFGAVDVLCNNAGVSIEWSPLVDVPLEQFDLAIKVNLYGVYNGVKAFGPDMIARRAGHIVNTSSFNGLISMGSMGPYSASKFGVTALSVALRQEMAAHGIGVSTVYPGATRSGMTSAIAKRHGDVMRTQNIMEPVWVGRAVVRAIEQNLPHVISHPGLRPAWDAWVDQLAESFGEPAQPGYQG
jgi:NAD(P)-dependent dehydrogenase (short-subunit alcohol dehydrogenase family)